MILKLKKYKILPFGKQDFIFFTGYKDDKEVRSFYRFFLKGVHIK